MEPHLEAYRTIDSFTDSIEPRWQPPLIIKRATLKDAQIEQIMMWTSFATERSLNWQEADIEINETLQVDFALTPSGYLFIYYV